MYSTLDLQKLVQMLAYLGIVGPGSYPAHAVVLGAGANAAPGAIGTLLGSNGQTVDPSFQTLAALGIQSALTLPLAIAQGGTGASTAGGALTALGAQAALGYTPAHSGANTDITSLASPALGSATATTQPNGTENTTVATTAFVANHSPIPNILDFGGDNSGSRDNSVALANALATGPSGQAAVFFPPGTYAFSAQAVYTMPTNTASVTILGAGQEVTKLVWAGGGGLKINFITDVNTVHIRDMTLETGATNAGYAIWLNQTAANTSFANNYAMSDISNITCRGSDGFGATDYWQNCVNISGVSNVNFFGVSCLGGYGGGITENGIGINISGSASLVPVQFNAFGCLFSNLAAGIVYGTYTQGLSVSGSNFTNCDYGIHAPAGITGLDQLSVSNSQFNCFTAGIRLETAIIQTQIVGNVFLVESTSTGVFLDHCSSTQIIGNSFGNSGGATSNNGVQMITYDNLASVISGNSFCQLTTAVNLAAGSKFVNVQSNVYSGNTNTVINSGVSNTVGGGSS